MITRLEHVGELSYVFTAEHVNHHKCSPHLKDVFDLVVAEPVKADHCCAVKTDGDLHIVTCT